MSQDSIKYKRAPSIRCRIIDLNNGIYDEEEKGIHTIYGLIRRARIVGNLIYKKVTDTEEYNTEDSMIKTQEGENTKMILLVDDGSAILWINLWGINPDNYQNINSGDLIQIVGTVKKKNNDRIIFYPNIFNRYDNPNYETLHILEMIKYIKEKKKSTIPISNNQEELTEDDIDSFIKSELISENKSGIDKNFSDEFDEDESEELNYDKEEIEETIFEIIKNYDNGDGVSIKIVIKNSGINKNIIEETLRKLSLNTKIYSTKNGNYKIYND